MMKRHVLALVLFGCWASLACVQVHAEPGDFCPGGHAAPTNDPFNPYQCVSGSPNAAPCLDNYGDYIVRFYQLFLNRFPETEGLAYWTYALPTLSPGVVATSILGSQEAQEDLQQAFQDLVSGQYSKGNFPDKQWPYYVFRWDLLPELAGSQYAGLHPSDADFVAALYHDLLRRDPDPAVAKALQDFLQNGGDRAYVVWSVLWSQEYDDDRIAQLYQNLLGRAPDQGAQVFRGQSLPTQIQGIVNSPEYLSRINAEIQSCAPASAAQNTAAPVAATSQTTDASQGQVPPSFDGNGASAVTAAKGLPPPPQVNDSVAVRVSIPPPGRLEVVPAQ